MQICILCNASHFRLQSIILFQNTQNTNSKMVKYEELKVEFIFVKFFLPVDIPLIPQTSSDPGPFSSQGVAVWK